MNYEIREMEKLKGQILLYQSEDGIIKFDVRLENDIKMLEKTKAIYS